MFKNFETSIQQIHCKYNSLNMFIKLYLNDCLNTSFEIFVDFLLIFRDSFSEICLPCLLRTGIEGVCPHRLPVKLFSIVKIFFKKKIYLFAFCEYISLHVCMFITCVEHKEVRTVWQTPPPSTAVTDGWELLHGGWESKQISTGEPSLQPP